MLNSPTKDDTITHLKESANELGADLHAAANQAGRKVRNMYDNASDEISHVSDKVAGEIRTNPVRSSMIALGIGLLFGTLLRR